MASVSSGNYFLSRSGANSIHRSWLFIQDQSWRSRIFSAFHWIENHRISSKCKYLWVTPLCASEISLSWYPRRQQKYLFLERLWTVLKFWGVWHIAQLCFSWFLLKFYCWKENDGRPWKAFPRRFAFSANQLGFLLSTLQSKLDEKGDFWPYFNSNNRKISVKRWVTQLQTRPAKKLQLLLESRLRLQFSLSRSNLQIRLPKAWIRKVRHNTSSQVFCRRFKMSTFVIVFLWHVLNSSAFRFCYCIINAVFRTKDYLFAELSTCKAVLLVFEFACV